MKVMWYVYLIRCDNESIYTGVTQNLERRFREHRTSQGAKHTRENKAIELSRSEVHSSQEEALKRERQIKGWRKEKKLNLIKFGHPNGNVSNS